MISAPNPDASLTQDERYTATSRSGLTYTMGDFAPGEGVVHRVAKGISWARIPLPFPLGHINSWLLDDHDGMAVVDTGLNLTSCADAWKALFKADLNDKKITRVICTHLHPDHIGLAGWLTKRDRIDLWMTRGEWLTARMLTADVRDAPPPEAALHQRASGWSDTQIAEHAKLGWGRLAAVVHPMPLSYRRMQDGDMLDMGAYHWRVVVGSGHSPEHACLLNETTGVIVTGDQVLPRISSNVSVTLTEPEADPLGDWLSSINKLLMLPEDLLVCPAHGAPFYGLHTRLKAMRNEHLERLDALAAALMEPKRAVDCFDLLFNRPITDDILDIGTGEAHAHLRRLERSGRARREVRDGVYYYHAA